MISFDIHGSTRHLQPTLLRACLWSVLFHFMVIASIELLHHYGFTEKGPLSSLLAPKMPELNAAELEKELEITLDKEPEPSIFFDADPSLETEEKPEDTPYYAVIDSIAGNPDISQDLDQPKLEGSQDKVFKTTDTAPGEEITPEPPVSGLQPFVPEDVESPPDTESVEDFETESLEPQEVDVQNDGVFEEAIAVETKEPEIKQPAEILTRIKPRKAVPVQQSTPPRKERTRPRTIAEAKKRNGMLLGESMKQEGGVKKFRVESSPDLLATPFGAYDAAIIQAIQQRWFGLLEGLPSARNASGKVTVKFQLMSNGKVMEMLVEEDTVGVIQSLLCQRAISDPAPYGKWPSDMRRLVGADYRQIRFSFYYN